MNKKKIACFALASALVIPGAIGLAGCEKGHTHAFTSDPYYEVVLEGETKVAKSWKECSCGAEDAHRKLDNAVIVTPTTAQDVLDTNVNGKTIVFDEGEYGNLEFRPTITTSKIYTLADGSDFNPDQEVTGTLDDETIYLYEREFNDITFAGTEQSKFKGYFDIEARQVKNGNYNDPLKVRYDYIKNKECTTDYSFVTDLDLNNITFSRLNFEGKSGRIHIIHHNTNSSIKNLYINNCSFVTETPDDLPGPSTPNSAIFIYMINEGNLIENVTFKGNYVDGHFQGIKLSDGKDVSFINNETRNTIHNGLGLSSSAINYFTGNLLIENNKIFNCLDTVDKNETDPTVWAEKGERAIRIGRCRQANVIIRNNIFNNSFKEVIASGANFFTNCTFNIYNNYYNDTKLKDASGTDEVFVISWC